MHCRLIFWVSLFISIQEIYFAFIYFKTITNSMEQGSSWEAKSSSLVKKFLALYGNPRFITVFTWTCHLSLSWARSIHSTPWYYFLKIHFNIILPSTPRCSKLPRSFRFPDQIPVCFSTLPRTCYMSRPSTSSWSLTRTIFGDYGPRSSSYNQLQSPVSSQNEFGVSFPPITLFVIYFHKHFKYTEHCHMIHPLRIEFLYTLMI